MYLIFNDSSFPGYAGPFDADSILQDAKGTAVSAATLADSLGALARGEAHTLIMLHGAYFPCSAWPAIYDFLQRGGNLIAAGGPVFSRPVRWRAANGGHWEAEPETWIYCRQLRLGPFAPVDLTAVAYEEHPEGDSTAMPPEYALVSTRRAHFLPPLLRAMVGRDRLPIDHAVDSFWAPTPQLSETNVHADEEGSAGALDTMLFPLACVHPVWCKDRPSGQRLATPLLVLDQLGGSFRGGRWLIMPWTRRTSSRVQPCRHYLQLIGACYPFVASGSGTLDIRPALGCYRINERPMIQLEWRRPRNDFTRTARGSSERWCVRLTVKAPDKQFKEILDLAVPMDDDDASGSYAYPLPFAVELQGMYTLTAIYYMEHLPATKLHQTGGFITWNDAAASTCDRIRPGRHLFFRRGADSPSAETPWFMFGTTYMDSRVQRHYLHRPNPLRWSRDLQEMRMCGINTIRTGLWWGWRDWGITETADGDIAPPKELMRALDAFVMVICRHRLQLIFNIFAFTPEPAGQHPYLDPKSLAIQERFVAFLARTYAAFPCVHWDLINEPSFGGPNQHWAGRARPHGDEHEASAFATWMQQQYTTLDRVRTRWQLVYPEPASWRHIALPVAADYSDGAGDTQFRRMLRAADFTRASQHWFRQWASRMAAALRHAGCAGMVTVGQDEAALRPLPQYHAPAVDFTSMHPWWNNNDVLWHYLVAKTSGKPAVAEEVGVMLARDLLGRPFRSELHHAALLKRKLYLSLCLGGAIQWLWHTNAYMTSENECQIGMIRADGSQKPELLAYLKFSDLLERVQHRWLDQGVDTSLKPIVPSSPSSPSSSSSTVWLVLLDHQWFARPALTTQATQMAVRVLSRRFGILPQIVTEEAIGQLASACASGDDMASWPASLQPLPQLVIVPGAQLISDAAFTGLLWLTSQRVHVHISGVLEQNEDALPALLRLEHMDVPFTRSHRSSVQPVARYEPVIASYLPAQFPGTSIETVQKSTVPPTDRLLRKGGLSWTGIPVELNEQPEIVAILYAQLLGKSPRKDQGLLVFKRCLRHAHLVVLINESSHPTKYSLSLKMEDEQSPRHLLFSLVVEGDDAGAILIIHDPNNASNENGTFLFGGVRHAKKGCSIDG
ncbi:glycoside hydrolase superfamily [Syncephalis pseudoplumigaleata]|uniref:Glycoside hydrolase superfamily n=1 Tax=Syncephalis pseudoplumigaleata TaxID=1712513 RepID=A0A4P9Z610_9FUNG|nr:glycoside hydrolase superfamily [Syncephalis pseudoplumigaleata]|eukprot:RKP27070.1 glycoside hydrolase superfamily [Syncephalis pseudoplumigaleata]